MESRNSRILGGIDRDEDGGKKDFLLSAVYCFNCFRKQIGS
ncbi:hypothetical protein Dpep_0063 [Dethiosulfovibrio peptidovorans DSM 11002]|uniref:Uncharacterized protein n=1 Tax=Dethiosulfovibrio peptidovorans DSM 11002 TaxID=469381 RepID=D2Z2D9_9BACT|nr:hypothetical protein Dpep_0063 [Dethiosulfovibrio peptidovorans DSM 11002]